MTIPYINPNDPDSIRRAFQKLNNVLGPASTPTFAGLTLTGLDASEFVFTDASKALSSVNVPLVVAYGGTGAATLTDHSLLAGSGTGAVTALGVATNGQLPIGSTGADPVLAGLTGTANQVTITNGAGSITLSTPQDIATSSSPTFAGLDLTGITDNNIPYMSASGFADSPFTTDGTDVTITGTLDASTGKILVEDNDTVAPGSESDGYLGVAYVSDEGRIYFEVNGTMYYVTGTVSAIPIEDGMPIGLLLSLTYNVP